MLTRLGLQIPSFSFPGVPDDGLFEAVASVAAVAESSGFDSLWVMDHFFQIPFVGDADEPMFEAYTLLGGLAARTTSARLGALVTGVTYRNPALLAKQVTALDVISNGRAVLGIGAAWNQQEHDGLGFEFPPPKERLERLEEALQICRSMFESDEATFEGRHYQVRGAYNRPRPIQPGGPPILVGGGGERTTLRLVARYADACNLFGDVATIRHKLEVLERHCETEGRDPAAIAKTRLGTLVIGVDDAEAERKVASYADERGVDPSLLRGMAVVGGPEKVTEELAAYFEAGLDGLMFNLPDAYALETVKLAGATLAAAFGTSAG